MPKIRLFLSNGSPIYLTQFHHHILSIFISNDTFFPISNSYRFYFFQIQSYFPGIIHVVYVIRPAGFFQKAISEVSSKFFKEDFKFRLMICSTLDDLFAHVERSQVTLDLGGELMYSHHEWIQQRIVSQVIAKIVYQISFKINLSQ